MCVCKHVCLSNGKGKRDRVGDYQEQEIIGLLWQFALSMKRFLLEVVEDKLLTSASVVPVREREREREREKGFA
jgi:hypothetical protein